MQLFFSKLSKSLFYAFNGLKHHHRETNFKIMLGCGFLALSLAFFLQLTYSEWLLLLMVIGWVLSLEALNTTLEKTLDYLEPNFSYKIQLIKDLLAGTVLLAVFTSALIGILLFLPKLIHLLSSW